MPPAPVPPLTRLDLEFIFQALKSAIIDCQVDLDPMTSEPIGTLTWSCHVCHQATSTLSATPRATEITHHGTCLPGQALQMVASHLASALERPEEQDLEVLALKSALVETTLSKPQAL